MIYITGDTHQFEIKDRFDESNFHAQKYLTKEDYVIVCGDFCIWDNSEEENEILNWLESRNFTTLFVSGNHENYDMLKVMEDVEWNGGMVNFIRPHIIHLKRGYVFNICGKKFFTFGGASSHDISDGILEMDDPRIREWAYDKNKFFRINHLSWWKEELPSKEEMTRGLENVIANDLTVDYVITHSPSTFELNCLSAGKYGYETDILTDYLDTVLDNISFEHHYFGHMHVDLDLNNKRHCVYHKIMLLQE